MEAECLEKYLKRLHRRLVAHRNGVKYVGKYYAVSALPDPKIGTDYKLPPVPQSETLRFSRRTLLLRNNVYLEVWWCAKYRVGMAMDGRRVFETFDGQPHIEPFIERYEC